MRQVVERPVNDLKEWRLPEPVRRKARTAEVPGKATTVVGMRCAGKTWICFQRVRELLDAGVARRRLRYESFEDERLMPFFAASSVISSSLKEVFRSPPSSSSGHASTRSG